MTIRPNRRAVLAGATALAVAPQASAQTAASDGVLTIGVQGRTAFQRMLDIYDELDPPGTALHDLVMLYGKKSSIRWSAYPMEYMDFGPGNLAFA